MSDQPNAEPDPLASGRVVATNRPARRRIAGGHWRCCRGHRLRGRRRSCGCAEHIGRGRILLSPRAHVHGLVGGELAQ